jgi:hypothetical protein
MLTTILVLTVINTLLQAIAGYQRHATLQLQKHSGNGGGP